MAEPSWESLCEIYHVITDIWYGGHDMTIFSHNRYYDCFLIKLRSRQIHPVDGLGDWRKVSYVEKCTDEIVEWLHEHGISWNDLVLLAAKIAVKRGINYIPSGIIKEEPAGWNG